MFISRWYVRAGRTGAWRYVAVAPGSVALVPDLADATRFDSKAEATVVQMELVAELGVQAACISDCPKARQQDEAKEQQHLDRAIVDLHEAGALNRDSIAAVNAAAEW